MAEIICEITGEKKWSDEPIAPIPFTCRIGWHKWCIMPVYRGMSKRGVVQRHACTRCGRVKMRRAGFWGGGTYYNGYIPTDRVGQAGY